MTRCPPVVHVLTTACGLHLSPWTVLPRTCVSSLSLSRKFLARRGISCDGGFTHRCRGSVLSVDPWARRVLVRDAVEAGFILHWSLRCVPFTFAFTSLSGCAFIRQEYIFPKFVRPRTDNCSMVFFRPSFFESKFSADAMMKNTSTIPCACVAYHRG